MKRSMTLLTLLLAAPLLLPAEPAHLEIMIPDLQDTDLKGPVKSVEVKLCRNVSGEFTTEKREYDRTGNLLKITERDEEGELVDSSTFAYDEDGCYESMVYRNEEKDYSTEWKVVLNPETREIALREITGDRIAIESYSPDGYLEKYRLLGADRKPVLARDYKRDENNRLTKFTYIEGRSPVYTYFFKWADNGFIDMEGQIYHEEKEKRRHTYEYLVTDDHGNWTQRIMVRYDIGGKKPVKVYEHTVVRSIEYYEDNASSPEDSSPETKPSSTEETITTDASGTTDHAGNPTPEDQGVSE